MSEKKLFKSKNKMIAGVCSGFAEFFGVDPTIVRIVWAAVTLLGGTGIILYIVCALVMPQPNS
ncbi:MAG: PspC domain-containing protein [Treponema sp.]|nr:PspC domain-containing protein [Treponema sp.]MBQ2553312.1 PspC domain-containing protein [Treponema sp.]MBQ4236259.1 PspC domain-containing protein [Treponema sp.]